MVVCTVRRATAADEPFLKEMLYEAIYVPVGEDPPPRSIVGRNGRAWTMVKKLE